MSYTPIFIPMPSGPPEPDAKCPKCGHEFDLPKPLSFWVCAGAALAVFAAFFAVLWFFMFLTDYENRTFSKYRADSWAEVHKTFERISK